MNARLMGRAAGVVVMGTLFWMLVAAATARAQPLADKLPAGTMVYLGWQPSIGLLNTAPARMLTDERVVRPWRRILQEEVLGFHDGLEGPRVSDHLPALLADAAMSEGCFALLELREAKNKNRFNPQSVLMINLGARKKSFEEHFAPLQSRLKERLGDRLKLMKLGGSWVYFRPDRDGKPRVTWGFVGETFVVFFGDGAQQFVPKLLAGKFEASLKDSKAFADSVGKIPGDSIFTTYLDTKATLQLAKHVMSRAANADFTTIIAKWDKLLDELGAGNVTGVAEKTAVEEAQFVTRTLIRTDGPAKGLLSLLVSPAVDDAMLKVVPADAMVVVAGRLDLAKTYEQVKASVTNVVGEDAREGFGQLEQGAEGVGLPLKEVLGALGDQWVVYNAQSHGGFALTGWTLVGTLREPEKFAKAVKTVRALATRGLGEHGHIRTINADGATVEYLDLGDTWFPLPVAWSVVGDKFVIGLYPQVVEDAVRQIKRPGRSILDNEQFVAARKRAGNAGPLAYVSGPDIVNNLYPIGLVAMQFINAWQGGHAGAGGDDADPEHGMIELLPSMRRLIDYVGYDAVGIKQTPDGVLKTRTVANPILSPLAWVDSPTVWLALGIPFLSGADEAADQLKSASNLSQVGRGLIMYANDNKGAFPPDLMTLTRTQDMTPDVLRSPYGPAKEGTDVVYVHHAGMTNKTVTPETVVAYDASALEQTDGTNVLFGDGRVEWQDAETFKKKLEETRKKAALQNAAP